MQNICRLFDSRGCECFSGGQSSAARASKEGSSAKAWQISVIVALKFDCLRFVDVPADGSLTSIANVGWSELSKRDVWWVRLSVTKWGELGEGSVHRGGWKSFGFCGVFSCGYCLLTINKRGIGILEDPTREPKAVYWMFLKALISLRPKHTLRHSNSIILSISFLHCCCWN